MQELSHEAFTFLEKNLESVMKLAHKMCRGRIDLIPDLYDTALDHVEGSIASYDHRCQASLRTHVLGNLRWYMWKVMNRIEKRTMYEIPEHATAPRTDSIEDTDAVQYVLESLDPYERDLLLARHVAEMSFMQMGRAIGACKDVARKHYAQALKHAQELADV